MKKNEYTKVKPDTIKSIKIKIGKTSNTQPILIVGSEFSLLISNRTKLDFIRSKTDSKFFIIVVLIHKLQINMSV